MKKPTAQADNPPKPGGVYLLLGGLVFGLLLGPLGLGKVAPQRYAALFPNPAVSQVKLQEIEKTRNTLAMTNVTSVALTEYDQQRKAEIDACKDAIHHANQNRSIMDALLLGSLCGLLVMGVASPLSRLHARLNLASHLLLATWLCILLTQPHLLSQLPGKVLGGGVLLLILAVACPPFKSKITAKETEDAQS